VFVCVCVCVCVCVIRCVCVCVSLCVCEGVVCGVFFVFFFVVACLLFFFSNCFHFLHLIVYFLSFLGFCYAHAEINISF
jgi:hypothetical protein